MNNQWTQEIERLRKASKRDSEVIERLHERLDAKKLRIVLVYQAGIANVFRVTSFNLSDYGRDAKRIMQSDFRSCEQFAIGCGYSGAIVKVAACNQAGDISRASWSTDLESQPFSDKYNSGLINGINGTF